MATIVGNSPNVSNSPNRGLLWGLFTLSAATLTFEINLTRLFSVTQFYHFAFLIVSVALLGFGASGTFLAIFPDFGKQRPAKTLVWIAIAAGGSMLGAYLVTNWLPFDSFQIVWNPKQVAILIVHLLVLSTPFFFSGLGTGTLLNAFPNSAGHTYAANLVGSALGCAVALIAPISLGAEGTVLLSCGLALAGGLVCSLLSSSTHENLQPEKLLSGSLLVAAFFLWGVGRYEGSAPAWMELTISPYKELSYAMQYPDAEVVFHRWNAFSRIDLVRSVGVRSLPGLSYRYQKSPPPEDGLLLDAGELSAVLRPGYTTDFFEYLPGAIAYHLLPDSRALILEPRGGLDVLDRDRTRRKRDHRRGSEPTGIPGCKSYLRSRTSANLDRIGPQLPAPDPRAIRCDRAQPGERLSPGSIRRLQPGGGPPLYRRKFPGCAGAPETRGPPVGHALASKPTQRKFARIRSGGRVP